MISRVPVLFLAAAALYSQEPPSIPGTPARALVTVEARKNGTPPTLSQKDIQVYEGKTQDEVTGWLPMQGVHAGLELLILIDDGSGPSVSTELNELRSFINSQPESTAVSVGYMRNGTVEYTSHFTKDHAQAAKTLRLPIGQAGISGSVYFSLSEVAKKWPGANAERREVLMISDGIDRYGFGTGLDDPYVLASIADAQRAGIVVFSIYSSSAGHLGHNFWRNTWGQNFLSRLSDETGGESFYIGIGNPVSFKPYLDDLSARLNGRQYQLTFNAQPENKAALRPIKVRTEVSNADVAYPDRVWVPAGK